MTTTKDHIASQLEQAFTRQGFAEPGVAALKAAAGVSLRTLYRHFPSRESMVIGALDYRHARYLEFLCEGEPPPGRESIVHLFHRLEHWMHENAPNGCLSLNAFAAYPGNRKIHDAVKQHKQEIVELTARRSGRTTLARELFLIHEGAAAAWPIIGTQASRSAQTAALKLMNGDNDD